MTGSCLVVTAEGFDIDVPFGDGSVGGRRIARGSLVREAPVACASGASVEVLAVNPWYFVPTSPAVGARGCVPQAALGATEGLSFVTTTGDLVSTCEAGARPITPAQLATIRRLRDVTESLFGPVGLEQLAWTDWGNVGLPLPHELSEDELGAEWAREGLDTPARRERAIVAVGPAAAYAHFRGSDAPRSDAWATPTTVESLLRLARGWYDHCAPGAEDPARCALQIGDLAWYNQRRPDPLGHRDHYGGACVDLRLFRTDASRYEAWWNRPDDRTGLSVYDRPRTIAFLKWALIHAPVEAAFFNDPAAVAAVPGVKRAPGHDDHIHLCFHG